MTTARNGALRITRLEVQDFQRLHAVDITRTGRGLVLLRGPNRAGKTSILNSIEAALAGGRSSPTTPVRKGAEKATVQLTLADHLKDRYRVTAEWCDGKRRLTVTDLRLGPDGVPVRKPQTVLDEMVGAIAFDPLKFARETNAEKRLAMLVSAAGIADEWDAKNAELDGSKNARRDANSEVKRFAAVAKSTPDPAPGETLEPVNASEALAKLRAANEQNAVRDRERLALGAARVAIADAEREIAELQERNAVGAKKVSELEQWLATNPPVVIAAIELEIVEADAKNERAAEQFAHNIARDGLIDAKDAANAAEARVAAGRESLRKLITGSPLAAAIKGLDLDEEAVPTINGIHLDGCSGTEKLLLSAQLAMLANPSLRVMCIDEADSLDAESIAALSNLAKKSDHDIWMTVVWADGPDDAQVVGVADGLARATCPA